MAKPIKVYKDGESKWIEEDRITRFVDEGWSLSPDVSPSVTKKVDEEKEWDPSSGEDWADSVESLDVDDNMPEEENE